MTNFRDLNRCKPEPFQIVTHQGFAVLVTNMRGEISEGSEGFFLHQTRFLSRFQIKVDEKSPQFVSAHAVDHHSLIAYYLAPLTSVANARAKPGEIVRKAIETVHLNAYTGGGVHFDIAVTNHSLVPAKLSLGSK